MAIIATYEQQPAERLDYDTWYANDPDGAEDWLVNGDTVETVDVESTPSGLTVERLVFPDRVKLWVSGGVHGVTYKVTVTANTVEGRIKQDETKFRIKEY